LGKVPRVPRPPVIRHTVSFVAGRWACSACGAACRKPNGVAALRAAECSGRHRLLDSVHFSHRLQAGWLGEGGLAPGARGQLPFAICTACGYFSSSRVVGLARVCTRRATAGRRRGIERTARGLHPTKAVHEVLLGLKAASGGAGGCGPGVPPCGPLPAGSGTGAPVLASVPCVASPSGETAEVGVSSIVDGAARAACKRASPGDRPSAIPPLAHGVRLPAGPGGVQAFSGLGDDWQAAGPTSEGASSGSCAAANASMAHRPPAIHSSPEAEPWDPFVEVESSVMYRPPAIHSSPEAEPWDPFVGDVSGGPGLDVDGLHVFDRTSAWCDFCGLPFQRTGRGTVSHLAGDTVAHEVGPRAAGVAVCDCGVGCA
jgi:hypothetical protein